MRRRDFIAGLGGAAATWPLASRAQTAKRPVIGYLAIGTAESRSHYVAAFHGGLREGGVVAGRNVEIEFRWAGESRDRFTSLAEELVARKVDVMFAGSIWAALAARKATRKIPTVFTSGSDPVVDGLVDSYNRPGGNATGIVFMATELAPKRLELLRELAPGRTVAVLLNAANDRQPDALRTQQELLNAAEVLGVKLLTVATDPTGDISRALVSAREQGARAVLVVNDPAFNSLHARLPVLMLEHGLPAIYFAREFAAAGGLMSYGPDYTDAYRHAGAYVARILKGTPPADLPVLQPTRFELVINLKTAATLGLDVPPMLLARADEVIE